MGAYGKYAYRCEDCEERTFLTRRDRSSRSRPHCSHCGSLRLSPTKSSIAKQRMNAFSAAKQEQNDRLKRIQNIK